MNLKSIIFIILFLVVLVFNFTSCLKCISTEYKNIEVTIVDKHHRGMWMQPIRSGKVTTYITHPSVWKIAVRYNGIEYTIDDVQTYNKYADKIGQTAIGKLEIKTYADGGVKYNIISLE